MRLTMIMIAMAAAAPTFAYNIEEPSIHGSRFNVLQARRYIPVPPTPANNGGVVQIPAQAQAQAPALVPAPAPAAGPAPAPVTPAPPRAPAPPARDNNRHHPYLRGQGPPGARSG